MSIAGLIAAFALIALSVAVVAWPLLNRRRMSDTAFIDKQRERALAYYERVLTNVRDLDEDHATGKIAPDEYQIERDFWVDRGAQVLKLLHELDQRHDIVASHEADDAEIDAAIERAIQAQRQPETQTASA